MDKILEKKENESVEAYQVRLTLLKQDGYDIDWSEIKELLGSDKNPDSIRKESYGIKIYDKYINQKKIDNVSCETLEEINEKLLEIKKEKIKLRDERNFVNNKIRQIAKKESFIECIKDDINNLSYSKPMINFNFNEDNRLYKNHAILMLSDWHVGITVDNYLNKYNLDICKQRLNNLCKKTISYCKDNNVEILYLNFLGDLISGEIHDILRIQNQFNLSEQLITTSELCSQIIYELSKHVKLIKIAMVEGNHDRSVQDKKATLDGDTYLYIIKEFVKLRIKDLNNVLFLENTYDEELITLNIEGWKFACLHGHNINRSKVSNQINNLLNDMFDYILLGHFHQGEEHLQYKTKVITNGSLVGSDTYSKKLKLHTYPMQKLLMVNKECGVYCTYDIRI